MKFLSFMGHKIASSFFINGLIQKDIKLLVAFKLKCKRWNSKFELRFINPDSWTQSKVRCYFVEKIVFKCHVEYDKPAIIVFKPDDKLVGQLSNEFSNLIVTELSNCFLENAEKKVSLLLLLARGNVKLVLWSLPSTVHLLKTSKLQPFCNKKTFSEIRTITWIFS